MLRESTEFKIKILATQPRRRPHPLSDLSKTYIRGTPRKGPNRNERAKTFPPISSFGGRPESLLIKMIGPPKRNRTIRYAAPSVAARMSQVPSPDEPLANAESGNRSIAAMSAVLFTSLTSV